MKLTDENADYEDCRPPVCRPHSPLVDALQQQIQHEVEAARALQKDNNAPETLNPSERVKKYPTFKCRDLPSNESIDLCAPTNRSKSASAAHAFAYTDSRPP